MSPWFTKKSALKKRIRKVKKDLSEIRGNIRSLSRSREKQGEPAGAAVLQARQSAERLQRLADFAGSDEEYLASLSSGPGPVSAFSSPEDAGFSAERGSLPQDAAPAGTPEGKKVKSRLDPFGRGLVEERPIGFLSTNFQPGRPLRHERRIQRNRAIITFVCVFLVLIWFLYMFVF